MRHGSLFTGIGGFDLAAQWMGWENVFQVECNGFCQKILAKNFPNVTRYGDIKEFDGTKYRGLIDIISGGFPCQPFSDAGKKQGTKDNRYLWPEMFRIIREIEPTYVIGENVLGLINMEDGRILDGILSDLANESYKTEQFIIPACSIGALHRRERIWIIAYTECRKYCYKSKEIQRSSKKEGMEKQYSIYKSNKSGGLQEEVISYTHSKRLQGNIPESQSQRYFDGFFTPSVWKDYSFESPICRTTDGISNRVDRIKGLGNAIVPQVAFEIFKAIEQYNEVLNYQL